MSAAKDQFARASNIDGQLTRAVPRPNEDCRDPEPPLRTHRNRLVLIRNHHVDLRR